MAEILLPRAVDSSSPPQLPRAVWTTRPRGDSAASSASHYPSDPYNTPVTRSVFGDQPHPGGTHVTLDTPGTLHRVDSTLSAVQDLHNETVDDELHIPTVPENTPCQGSPISVRFTLRNLPTIDEKLENLPSAITSPRSVLSMSCSPPPSVMGERGQGEQPYGLIPVALGSPREVDYEMVNMASIGSHLAATPRDALSPLPPAFVPLTTDALPGVREQSDWQDTIEEDLDRDLTRLANLANDDFQRDPSMTAADHYHHRLARLLSNSNRRYMITELGEAVVSTMAERGSLMDVRPAMVTNYEFQNLRSKVHDIQNVFSGLLGHLSQHDEEINKLSKMFEELMKQYIGKNGG